MSCRSSWTLLMDIENSFRMRFSCQESEKRPQVRADSGIHCRLQCLLQGIPARTLTLDRCCRSTTDPYRKGTGADDFSQSCIPRAEDSGAAFESAVPT